MKRFFALLLSSLMICSMFAFTSSATNYVISPEYGDVQEDPTPQSPQTGEEFGVAGFAVVAAMCGAVAVVSTKKAAKHS